jgi:PAS domain S-box-containing protein
VAESATRPVRILIVDDDVRLLSALADLIGDDDRLALVGAATNVAEAIVGSRREQPDVALVDVRMPDGGGERLTRVLAAISPRTRVIAHSAFADGSSVRDMVRAGAHGYLVKGEAGVDVVQAVLAQSAGQDTFQVPARWIQDVAAANAAVARQARELNASTNPYAVLFEESPAGKMLIGPDLRPIRVNRALCRMLGFGVDELCAMDVRDLTDPDQYEAVTTAMGLLQNGGMPQIRLESRCRTKAGAMVWMDLVATLVRDDAGAPLYIQTVFWDITDQKQATSARLESEARFRDLVEGLPGYVYICAAAAGGKPSYVSPHVLNVTGYGPEEYLAEPNRWTAILHPEDRDRVLAAFDAFVAGGPGFEATYRIVTKGGATRWIRDHGTLVKGSDGSGRLVQGVVLDVTDAQQAEEARLDNVAKTKFLASMSHELRTPLNSILGFAQLLATGSYGDLNDRQERYVSNINSSGQHLLALINDVLDLAKVRAGEMQVEVVPLSLSEAIADVLAKMGPLSEIKEVRLEAGPRVAVRVLADRRRLHQVLLNLVSNAIKFTPAGGSITVGGRLRGDAVQVSVADNGTGIDEADQARIFDEFAQGGNAADQQGTGLGLTLTRQLVELMNGRIEVASRLGAGSTFTFTLPAA